MKGEDRKAAVAAFKERKIVAGIYALRCLATGQCWAGRALNIDTVQNRLWFTLRQGANPHLSLQAAWREHGAESFAFEELERLDDEALAYVRDGILKRAVRLLAREARRRSDLSPRPFARISGSGRAGSLSRRHGHG